MKNAILFFTFLFVNAYSFSQIADFKDINFTKADNIAKLHKGASIKNLPLLCHNLTYKLNTDAEKFRAIYTWVCNNIKGDNYLHNKVTKKRKKYAKDSIGLLKWNTTYKKTIFKKLVNKKKTMCTGYAYLIKEMATIVGLDCKIIEGYGRSVNANIDALENLNHSWNAVKINNKWYLCDATWSSGYMDGKGTFIQDYNNGYFLTEPTLFAKNHFPKNQKWLLSANTSVKTFTTAPIVYGESFKHKIILEHPQNLQVITKRKEPLFFKIKSLKNIANKRLSLIFMFGNKEKEFNIYDVHKNKDSITFKNKFKWKGYYDVHLKVNKDIVATYTIKVTN